LRLIHQHWPVEAERLRLTREPQTVAREGSRLTREPQTVAREGLRLTREPQTMAREGSRLTREPQTVAREGLRLTREPQTVAREGLRLTREPQTVAREGLRLTREPQTMAREGSRLAREAQTVTAALDCLTIASSSLRFGQILRGMGEWATAASRFRRARVRVGGERIQPVVNEPRRVVRPLEHADFRAVNRRYAVDFHTRQHRPENRSACQSGWKRRGILPW
jgi:DNA-binding winged helix-turn-helix (wHTH) protein